MLRTPYKRCSLPKEAFNSHQTLSLVRGCGWARDYNIEQCMISNTQVFHSTYQFLLKLCEGKGNIGIGGGWGETKEAKLAENGGVVVQGFRNLHVQCRGRQYSKSSK